MKASIISAFLAAAGSASARVPYAGVNIAGFDFSCDTSGNCRPDGVVNPGSDGIAQMKHFVTDDGLNAFRLPVSWQFLLNNNLGGTLDANNFAAYDKLVQGCLGTGAAICLLDLHNYARWNGGIIGQGGPTNAQFASVWSQLAAKYASKSKVAFGIMNEPHDLNITTWAGSAQAAVTAIRNAGANNSLILIPGTDYSSAGGFLYDGSSTALSKVVNPDGSKTNIAFDVHLYLDSDGSGTHSSCTTNNSNIFTNLGNWLRSNNRKAFLTETGGGSSDSSCLQRLCEQFNTINSYSDVYLGWIGWAAGAFGTDYVLSETPKKNSDGTYTDQPLLKQCVAGKFTGATKKRKTHHRDR